MGYGYGHREDPEASRRQYEKIQRKIKEDKEKEEEAERRKKARELANKSAAAERRAQLVNQIGEKAVKKMEAKKEITSGLFKFILGAIIIGVLYWFFTTGII